MSIQTVAKSNPSSDSWGDSEPSGIPDETESSPAPRVETRSPSIKGVLGSILLGAIALTLIALLIAGGNREPLRGEVAPSTEAPTTGAPAVSTPVTAAPPVSVVGEIEDRAAELTTPVNETTVPTAELVEPTALVTNGVLTLDGTQPSAEAAARLVDAASEILGAENVVNNYVIDDRADATRLGKLEIYDTLHFVPGTNLLDEQSVKLMELAQLSLETNPDQILTVIAHTNDSEDIIPSLIRSQERAAELTATLEGWGVDPGRVISIGRGSSEPMFDNALDVGQRLNERVVLLLN